MKRAHIFVSGHVQGVGFRFFVQRLATELNLKGWVRNADSRVEIDVEGPAEQIDELQRRLRSDKPRLARVDDLEVSEPQLCGFKDFRVESST